MDMNTATLPARLGMNLTRVVAGAAGKYRATSTTPDSAYQSMIQLFCQTGGYSSDFMHALIAMRNRPRSLAQADGALGRLSEDDVRKSTAALRSEGYYIFPSKLAADVCDRLTDFALANPARPLPRREGQPELLQYDRAHPIAENYRLTEQTSLESPDVQNLIADTSIIAVAQAYLGTTPILDLIGYWWSTAFSKTASSEAAQLFHFDMDRIKWLKFFFFLTDVTPETGPHVFVAKSHRRGGQPKELLRRGYVRISDADIERHYPRSDILEISGPRGTIFAADTRAFHKGKPLERGERLLLQFEFCDSLFGAAYQRLCIRRSYSQRLREMALSHPRIYSKFDVESL